MEGLPGLQKAYARVAWKFLDTCGFINFGEMQQVPEQGCKPREGPRRNVIIIGAGMAGREQSVSEGMYVMNSS